MIGERRWTGVRRRQRSLSGWRGRRGRSRRGRGRARGKRRCRRRARWRGWRSPGSRTRPRSRLESRQMGRQLCLRHRMLAGMRAWRQWWSGRQHS